MGYPDTTDAFAVTDIKKWSEFTRKDLPLKKFEEDDVDIAVDACGVCASDIHTITGGWSEDIPLPLCVGHEIIGKVVKVGKNVKNLKVGDRAGVGAQVGADLTCNNCKADNENYCPNQIDTYGAPYPDGTISQGGYSSHVRVHNYFAFKIPDSLETTLAAPMLCAGLTVFSPLKRLGCGKGKKDDALKMGAKEFICTKDKDWHKPYAFTFDVLLNTADATDKFNLPDYFSTLKPNGFFHMVGLPDKPLPTLMAQDFMPSGSYIGASHIGNRPEMEEMLELAAKQDIKSWVETIDISEKGCKEAVERVYNNDNVRYRFTLTNFDKVFGKRA
ncbi:GroES-like protein [Periconia macrospinosa]|uniref:GroES-like protein n=1 Tax=Periconia macrospinosa TaxID=97972 RepID=A0A2V1DNV1_9PLEO|nr:GroES-like protein [Periconia macrospinosa]